MPLPPFASEARCQTKRRILRAAIQAFQRKEYSATSVREIVSRAGVTKPAFYYYFRSKWDIFEAIQKEAASQVAVIAAREFDRAGTVRQRVVDLCEDVCSLHEGASSALRVTQLPYVDATDGARGLGLAPYERVLAGAVERIVAEAQLGGETRTQDPSDVALVVVSVVGTTLRRRLCAGPKPSDPRELRELLQLVFDGVQVAVENSTPPDHR